MLAIYRSIDLVTGTLGFPFNSTILSNTSDTLEVNADPFQLPPDATLPVGAADRRFSYIIGPNTNSAQHYINSYSNVILIRNEIVVVQGLNGREVPPQFSIELSVAGAVRAEARLLTWYGLGELSNRASVGEASNAPGAPSIGEWVRTGNSGSFPFTPGARNDGHTNGDTNVRIFNRTPRGSSIDLSRPPGRNLQPE